MIIVVLFIGGLHIESMRLTTVRTGLAAMCFCLVWGIAGKATGYRAPVHYAGQASRENSIQLAAVKRIYVEAFAVKKGSTKLRGDVVGQLRRLNNITIVSKASQADAILTGAGEIWVRGYQSLNPRSGHLPYDGRPIYSGFLSVELKDAMGDTLWSYLVTPGPPSEDITKDLSKRLGKHLAEALGGSATGIRH